MTAPVSSFVQLIVVVLATGLVGFATNSISWSIAALFAGLLAIRLFEDRELRAWSKNLLQRPSNLPKYWSGTANRITRSMERGRTRTHTLLDALKRVRTTTDQLQDAWVIIREPSGEIEFINKPAINLLGLNRSDEGQLLTALIRNPQLDSLIRAGSDQESVEIKSPNSEELTLELRLIPLEENRAIVVARDVTDLNRLLTMRQDFIANVSHELRTPLTVLLGYIESALTDELDYETLHELVSRLQQPTIRMQRLVEDLLTLTRLESSDLPDPNAIEQVHGAAMINDVMQEAQLLSKGKHDFSVDTDNTLVIPAVPSEIHSVFMNLVSNAVRYSPDGGSIRVRWLRNQTYARFEVEDEGVGIAPEHMSRITERFYRIDLKKGRVSGGTGLGLAIVKHALRRYQSELRVESDLGRGSTFYFDFPMAE